MEPERTPVTIVNPHAPTGTPDLLSSGRDPWRPSRRQLRLCAAVTAVVTGVSGAAALGWYRHHDRVLDAASVRGVLLAAVVEGDPPTVGISNLTPDAIQLIGARMQPEGERLSLDQELLPGSTIQLPWRDARRCTLELLQRPLTSVTIDARTHRGALVSTTLDLLQVDSLNEQARHRCGYLTPVEAFSPAVMQVTRIHRGITIALTLRNLSVLPLTLTQLATPPGMTMTGIQVPLTLPSRSTPFHVQTGDGDDREAEVRLSLVLRITDCSRLLRGSLDVHPFLDGVVRGPTASEPIQISLGEPTGDVAPDFGGFAAFYELPFDCGRVRG